MFYNISAVDSFQQEGGEYMESVFAFVVSVVAGVVSNYICKWLDKDKNDS